MKGGRYDRFLWTFPHCTQGGTRRYVAHRGGRCRATKNDFYSFWDWMMDGVDKGKKFDGGREGNEGIAQLRTRAAGTRDIFGRGGEGGRAGTADMHRDLSYVQPFVRHFFFPPFLRPSFSPPREFELSVFVLGGISYPMAYRCKSVQQLQDHHIRYYLARNHPIVICVRPSPFSYIFSPHTQLPLFIFMYGPSPRSPTSCRASAQTDR